MIFRKQGEVISWVRLTAILVVSLGVALLSAACSSQSTVTAQHTATATATVTVTAQPSPTSPAASSRALAVDPISGGVTVTPSTSLKSVSTVTVSVSRFQPNMKVFVQECAHINGLFICESKPSPPTKDPAGYTALTTDQSGNGSTRLNVRRVFNGFVVGGGRFGQVDCTKFVCYVGVGNHTQGAGSGQLSFGSA